MRRFIANLAMDFATIHSAEYAEVLLTRARPSSSTRSRSAPGPSSSSTYQKDAVIRLQGVRRLGGQARGRRSRLCHHARPDGALCQAQGGRVPRHDRAESGRPRRHARRRRLSTCSSQAGLNIGYSGDEHAEAALRQAGGAPGHRHGDRPRAIIKEVYQGAGQKAKNLIPPTMWSYDDATTDFEYNPEKAKEMLKAAGVEDARDRPLVHAGAAPLQPECQAHRRDDAGRSGQGRHQRQARDL